jgi:hypothetical protein
LKKPAAGKYIYVVQARGLVMPLKIGTESILQEFSPLSTKNIEVTSILHQLHGFSQVSPKKNGRLRQLKKLINQRKLTESLEMLEKTGISGDFALFIIQNIQTLEVV